MTPDLADPTDRTPPSLRPRLDRLLVRLRRHVLRRRRVLAAGLTCLAVAATLSATRAPAPPTTPVLVAARDLPAGSILTPADVSRVDVARSTAPPAATSDIELLEGRVLAAPVGVGEPITTARLVGPGLADLLPTRSAVPLRLPDPGMVALLEVGDTIDLLATDPEDGHVTTVASAVPVLAVPGDPGSASTSALPGSLLVVALTASEVAPVAEASLRKFVTYRWSKR